MNTKRLASILVIILFAFAIISLEIFHFYIVLSGLVKTPAIAILVAFMIVIFCLAAALIIVTKIWKGVKK